MIRPADRIFVRLALVGVLAAALGLAACGRKGPLELPPSSAADATAQQPGVLPSGERAPADPNAPKKRFFLDFLL